MARNGKNSDQDNVKIAILTMLQSIECLPTEKIASRKAKKIVVPADVLKFYRKKGYRYSPDFSFVIQGNHLVVIEVDQRKYVINSKGKKQGNGVAPASIDRHAFTMMRLRLACPQYQVHWITILESPYSAGYIEGVDELGNHPNFPSIFKCFHKSILRPLTDVQGILDELRGYIKGIL